MWLRVVDGVKKLTLYDWTSTSIRALRHLDHCCRLGRT
ncbi:hypothetical protein ACNKHR_26830 [Shigella flexneri]